MWRFWRRGWGAIFGASGEKGEETAREGNGEPCLEEDSEWDPEEAVVHPMGDVLDLHTFRPGEAKDLVNDYLLMAREEGYRRVRIVHGKGTGQLRRTVHAVLSRHPLVESFRLEDPSGGGWGATEVVLAPKP